ncbi:MAG: ferredoxin [Planctomycetota bacterium]|nr:ferredoxin [Planctomycetota bacterium]
MPDPNEKWEDNVPGPWYVDKSCIFCGLCPQLAPENFRESEDGTHDLVYKQPENDEEKSPVRRRRGPVPPCRPSATTARLINPPRHPAAAPGVLFAATGDRHQRCLSPGLSPAPHLAEFCPRPTLRP